MVTIKSLGDRNDQVNNGLITLGVVYPNATIYRIIILGVDKTCYYNFNGEEYRKYVETKNATERLYLHERIQKQIEMMTSDCS